MSMYIIDAAILIAALYLLFSGLKMKSTGKIPKAVMGEELVKNCTNQEGFVNDLFPWMMMFSVVTLIGGIVGFCLEYFNVFAWASYITCGIFLVVFIVFCIMYKKAIKKYFKDM